MGEPDPSTKRRSDILEAIFEQVSDKPERSAAANTLFRAKALAQLDVAAEIDNQLPLVSRRSWLLLVGVALLAAGFALWAALTPSITAVSAVGRAAATPGAVPVVAPVSGVLVGQPAASGAKVAAGQEIARILAAAGGATAVRATTAGTVWQSVAAAGDPVQAGADLVSILPAGPGTSLLLVLPQEQAAAVAPGMSVRSGSGITGQVTSVGAPVPAATAAARTALPMPQSAQVVIVVAEMGKPLPDGALVSAQVILSDRTVLQRIWGQS